MGEAIQIARDGTFQLGDRSYQIPDVFSPREVFSYRRLLEPIPDIPGGTSLSGEQRTKQMAYFFCRAAACVIPGLEPAALATLPFGTLEAMHGWIAAHRPELCIDARLIA